MSSAPIRGKCSRLRAGELASMSTLILTTDDSAAGCLKASAIANRVIGIDFRLVTGPVPPVSDPLAFFAERARLGSGDIGRSDENGPGSDLGRQWLDLIDIIGDFDRVEIWADPKPNAQLLLLHLLDWFNADRPIGQKLSLTCPPFFIGNCTPESVAALGLRAQRVSDTQFATAKAALHAFQQATPEAWFNLLRDDLDALPRLRSAVVHLLKELPAVDTGLAASETGLLEIISVAPIGPMHALGQYIANDHFRVLNYWELGTRLHGLAHCQTPAIIGLEDGPFSLELHDDRERFEKYQRTKLSISGFGQAVLERREDFSQHNAIDRWWGGTRLTNQRLWRWDATKNILISPT
jgi:hypothetical protein